ncbi:MAG: hypothetical protein HC846_09955 [Blastocatellia bacterium]|nr:hypothetical protein [Blastocatellia bacterium]
MENIGILESKIARQRLNLLKHFVESISSEISELSVRFQEKNNPRGDNEFDIGMDEQIRDFEKVLIETALIKSAGNQSLAAKLLKIKPSTLNQKIKRHKINVKRYSF